MTEWREFEALIADLQTQTAPDASVASDQRVKGRSGRIRQLDITISRQVGLYPVLIVIECKRYKRQVGIDKVESFVTKLRDVGASQGVMISNTGFDAGARAIARDNLVTLLSYREAKQLDWHRVVGSEAWLSLLVTQAESISISFFGVNQEAISHIPTDSTLYGPDGVAIFTPAELYQQLEESFAISSELGNFESQVVPEQPVCVKTETGLQLVRSIIMRGTVKGHHYVVNLSLASGHVLEKADSQETVFTQLASHSIDKDALLRTPGREITKEEYELLKGQTTLAPVQVKLSNVKKYLRVVATKQI